MAKANSFQTAGAAKSKRVVIAVDDSDESMYALNWALNNVIMPADLVHILHAQRAYVEGSDIAEDEALPKPAGIDGSNENRLEEYLTRNVLEKAVDLCKAHEVAAEGDMVLGEPQEGICMAAEQLKADLLIIGSHGRGLIARALVGSVSDYCVHHASCPVLVVKIPQ